MSGFAVTTQVEPPGEVARTSSLPAASGTDETQLVRLWRKRVEDRKGQDDFKENEKYKAEAKKCGKNDILDDDDVKSWEGASTTADAPIVQVGLWPRIRAYYVDAIFSNNPNLSFRPNEGRSSPETLKQSAAVEAMVKYIWEQCKQQPEARRALRDAWNSNVSVVEIVYDPARGLYRGRWVSGAFVPDGTCHGDLGMAYWVVKEMKLPVARILTDATFDKEKRLKLYEKWKPSLEKAETGGFEQVKTVYYICSREGVDPLAGVKELAGEIPEGSPKKVLFAIVEGFDEFLFVAPDPYPYLDEDEYNTPVLTLAEEPGEWFGTPQWKMLKGLLQAINWLVTFHVAAMKKKATTVVLVNKTVWPAGADDLQGAAFMEGYYVNGDPRMAAMKLDLGSNDSGQLESAEKLFAWAERVSGFNQVAQGESSGRKTATEADSLQRNTALVVKGPSDSFDCFLNEWVRQLALATLYYIPQYSRTIGPDGMVMTQEVQAIPTPMAPAPGPDGAPPDPMAPPQVQDVPTAVPVPAPPEDAKALGAIPWLMDETGQITHEAPVAMPGMPPPQVQDFGLRMPDTQVEMTEGTVQVDEMGNPMEVPGVPIFTHPTPGKVLTKGVDYFCPGVAIDWPVFTDLDDVKRDLAFTFEAGSTRADWRHDKQQAAQAAITLLGPILQTMPGGFDALYELLQAYTQAMPNDNSDHFLPPREVFVQGMEAAMAAAQMAQQQGTGTEKHGPPQKGPQAS